MKIRTNYDTYFWTAVDDDTYDGAPDSHCPIGVGKTEQEAINDLLEQIGMIMTKGRFSDLVKDRNKHRTLARQLAGCLRDLTDGYDESNTRQRARVLLAEFDQLEHWEFDHEQMG